jgi:hypothetical protein
MSINKVALSENNKEHPKVLFIGRTFSLIVVGAGAIISSGLLRRKL